jgi:hypothetical protein
MIGNIMRKDNISKTLNDSSLSKKINEYIDRVKAKRPSIFLKEPEGVINTTLDHKGGKNEKW